MPKLDPVVTMGAAMAATIAIVAIGGGDEPPRKPAQVATDKLHGVERFDPERYHEAITAAQDATTGAAIDVLSHPAAPGETVTAGVNVPRGSRPSAADLIGEAVGSFAVEGVTFEDRERSTWIEVRARNTSSTTRRLMALVEYTGGAP